MDRQCNCKTAKLKVLEVNESIALYRHGSDIVCQKILDRIYSMDKYRSWTANQFNDFGKREKIRLALEKLVKKGYLVKVKSLPVFYNRK